MLILSPSPNPIASHTAKVPLHYSVICLYFKQFNFIWHMGEMVLNASQGGPEGPVTPDNSIYALLKYMCESGVKVIPIALGRH